MKALAWVIVVVGIAFIATGLGAEVGILLEVVAAALLVSKG